LAEILRVIGLEDFIAMKVFAGGPQDLEDARRAIAVSANSFQPSTGRNNSLHVMAKNI